MSLLAKEGMKRPLRPTPTNPSCSRLCFLVFLGGVTTTDVSVWSTAHYLARQHTSFSPLPGNQFSGKFLPPPLSRHH